MVDRVHGRQRSEPRVEISFHGSEKARKLLGAAMNHQLTVVIIQGGAPLVIYIWAKIP